MASILVSGEKVGNYGGFSAFRSSNLHVLPSVEFLPDYNFVHFSVPLLFSTTFSTNTMPRRPSCTVGKSVLKGSGSVPARRACQDTCLAKRWAQLVRWQTSGGQKRLAPPKRVASLSPMLRKAGGRCAQERGG